MTYFTNVTTTRDESLKKLHLFWVCEPGKKGKNIRTCGYTKEEAYKKTKALHPTASVLWKKEL
tara:strand:+ start:47 stop:235 length:189 start_codon:yes stop_codon:yes gene_type:complete